MIDLKKSKKDMGLKMPEMMNSMSDNEGEGDDDYYPSVYISDIDGESARGLKLGQNVTIKGKLVEVTTKQEEGDETPKYCCEVECIEMELGKIEKSDSSKASVEYAHDESAVKKGLDEAKANVEKKTNKKE